VKHAYGQSKTRARKWNKTSRPFASELARVRPAAPQPRWSKSPGELLRLETPLRQLAGLSAPEPRLNRVITPYDKGAMHDIEKAIQTSDLGLTPMNDGKIIRHSDSRADRGAPQGSGEARPQNRRGNFPRRRPQPSPRRQRHAQGTAQGKQATRTRCAPARPRCRLTPPSSSKKSTKC